jgi:hypothetical protein
MEIGRESTQSVKDSLWKRLWTCRKTDYDMKYKQTPNWITVKETKHILTTMVI